jgi:hypothetical protein
MHDEGQARWRKSSYSGNDANCVELTWLGAEAGIRDSKSPTSGELTMPSRAFRSMVRTIKHS